MRLKLLFSITLVWFVNSFTTLFAQDLILTNQGDSINCKITKVKTDNIYFTFKHKDEFRSTLLPLADIVTHQFNFYQTGEVKEEYIVGYENYQHFRLAFNGGYSYHTAKLAETVPSDFKNYYNELKSGYHFGGDITYYFTEPLGLGFKYYVFKTTNTMDNIYREDLDGNRTYGHMRDDLTISFIGPTFSTRLLNQAKSNAVLMNMSLGYMGYSNDLVLIEQYKMTGRTLGLALDIGYDIGLSKNVSLGFQISFLTGTLFKYDWNDGVTTQTVDLKEGEYNSLNRIDFSVGLRFNQ